MRKLLKIFLLKTPLFLCAIQLLSAQVDDEVVQKYLESYLTSGDPGMVEKIRQEVPDSKYDRFCVAYELLDVDNEKGIVLSRQLVLDFPVFPEANFAFGTFLINGSKEYDSAITYLNRAIELKPDFASAWFNRGIGKINVKDYEGAKSDFSKVLEKDQGKTDAHIMRAVSAYMLQDYDTMLSDIEIAIQIDPYILSDLYFIQVRNTIDKAIELAPGNVNLYYARGFANFTSGYFRLAIHDFITAIQLDPSNSEYYKMSGASKIYLGDGPGAEVDLKTAIDINPEDAGIYYYLGLHANDLLLEPEKSYEYLTRAIELDSLNAIYYYQRAWSSYNLYDYEMTITDLEKAFQLNSRNGDFYTLRALTLLDCGFKTEYNYCQDFSNAEKFGTTFKVKNYINLYCKE